MTVQVEFPDGSVRAVASARRVRSWNLTGSDTSEFDDEPLHDQNWTFKETLGGRWLAYPRR